MARGIRKAIDSIVFAGMKPGTPAPSALYLSSRTLWQKIRIAILFGVPGLVVACVMVLALSNHFAKKPSLPPPPPTPGETVAKLLPNLDNVRIDIDRDVEVTELRIDRSGATALMGTVQNNTTHQIHSAEIVFDLTDGSGSQLGGVSQKLDDVAPKARVNFRLPIEQKNARLVLIREIHTQ